MDMQDAWKINGRQFERNLVNQKCKITFIDDFISMKINFKNLSSTNEII